MNASGLNYTSYQSGTFDNLFTIDAWEVPLADTHTHTLAHSVMLRNLKTCILWFMWDQKSGSQGDKQSIDGRGQVL